MAGDRPEFAEWTTTFLNDTDFMIRNAMERWNNGINDLADNTGVINAADYFLGCDSVGQHFAHAMNKPATIVTGATYPENISYPENKKFTIIDNGYH